MCVLPAGERDASVLDPPPPGSSGVGDTPAWTTEDFRCRGSVIRRSRSSVYRGRRTWSWATLHFGRVLGGYCGEALPPFHVPKFRSLCRVCGFSYRPQFQIVRDLAARADGAEQFWREPLPGRGTFSTRAPRPSNASRPKSSQPSADAPTSRPNCRSDWYRSQADTRFT